MPDSSPSTAGRRRSSLHAASVALFGDAESPLLATFDSEARRVVLRSGETLFRRGDVGDALYVVTHGSLEVLADREGGASSRLDVIGRGGVVGEMALLTNESRSATVRAIRDSELVRIDKAAFDELLVGRPAIAIDLARSLVSRLRRATSGRGSRQNPRTIAFIPVDDSARAAASALTRKLVDALAR
jgi:CRP-like cAMP-binding protein